MATIIVVQIHDSASGFKPTNDQAEDLRLKTEQALRAAGIDAPVLLMPTYATLSVHETTKGVSPVKLGGA